MLFWRCGQLCRPCPCCSDTECLSPMAPVSGAGAQQAARKPPVFYPPPTPQQAALPCMGFWAAWPSLPGALRPVPGLWLRVFTPVFVQGGREGRGRCWGNWNSAGHRAGWARWPGRAKGLQGEAIEWGMFIVAGQESHASHSPRACNGVGPVPIS